MPSADLLWAIERWKEQHHTSPLWASSRPQIVVLEKAITALGTRFRPAWEAYMADNWYVGHSPKGFASNPDKWAVQAAPVAPLLEQPKLGFEPDFVEKKVEQAKADHAERLRRHREGTAGAMLASPKLDKDSQKRLMREALSKLKPLTSRKIP